MSTRARVLWAILGAACFVGVIAAVQRSITVAASLEVHWRPGPLLVSASLFGLQHLLAAALWFDFLAMAGCAGRRRDDAASWLISQFGKYTPANISGLAVRAARSSGSVEQTGLAVIYEALGHSAAAGIVGLPALVGLADRTRLGASFLLLLALMGLAALASGRLARFANFLLARLGRPPLRPPRFAGRRLLGLALALIVHWLLAGTSFWLMARGLGIEVGWGLAAPAAALAWVAGFLVVVLPGGIGVRESLFVLILAPQLGPPAAVLLATASRAWVTVLDLAASAAGGYLLRSKR